MNSINLRGTPAAYDESEIDIEPAHRHTTPRAPIAECRECDVIDGDA